MRIASRSNPDHCRYWKDGRQAYQTRRQGEGEPGQLITSPCLLISLSPCLLVSLSYRFSISRLCCSLSRSASRSTVFGSGAGRALSLQPTANPPSRSTTIHLEIACRFLLGLISFMPSSQTC